MTSEKCGSQEGRDFFDLVFLMSRKVKPEYNYLEDKIGMTDPESVKQHILDKCQQLDMKAMAEDVEPFLFEAADVKKIIRFEEVVRQYSGW